MSDAWNLSVADADQLGSIGPPMTSALGWRRDASRYFVSPVPLDDEIVIGPVQRVPLTSRRAQLRAFDNPGFGSQRQRGGERIDHCRCLVGGRVVDHEPRFHVQLAKMSVRSFCG